MLTRRKMPVKTHIVFILLLFTMFVFNSALPVYAASLSSSYANLKNDPVNQQFIQTLLNNGATEAQIESFLNNLDSEVSRAGTLNEANFNSVLYDALREVLTWPNNRNVLLALTDGFPDEIDYVLQNGTLHPNLVPLRNAVRDSVLGSPVVNPPAAGGGGGGGGGIIPPTTSTTSSTITQQLNAGNSVVSLSVNESSGDITIPAASLQQLTSAGKELEIQSDKVVFRIPSGALSIGSSTNLSISVQALSSSSAATPLEHRATGQTLVGPVYEFNSTTEASVNGVQFQKPITVTLSFAGADLSAVDVSKLDVFYYNQSTGKWDRMNGTIDKNARKISFTTSHFSKYAVMTIPEVKPVPVVTPPSQNKPVVTANFSDLNGHWGKQNVEELVALGLVSGVSPTLFAPDRNITRAEFAALLVRAVGLKSSTTIIGKFQDVAANEWYFGVVNTAANAGLVSGLSSSSFGPDKPITREQMAVMIERALSYKGKTTPVDSATTQSSLAIFTDQTRISSWARSGVATVVRAGIVKGRGNGYFAPSANATRAEAAVMILKMYKQF